MPPSHLTFAKPCNMYITCILLLLGTNKYPFHVPAWGPPPPLGVPEGWMLSIQGSLDLHTIILKLLISLFHLKIALTLNLTSLQIEKFSPCRHILLDFPLPLFILLVHGCRQSRWVDAIHLGCNFNNFNVDYNVSTQNNLHTIW